MRTTPITVRELIQLGRRLTPLRQLDQDSVPEALYIRPRDRAMLYMALQAMAIQDYLRIERADLAVPFQYEHDQVEEARSTCIAAVATAEFHQSLGVEVWPEDRNQLDGGQAKDLSQAGT